MNPIIYDPKIHHRRSIRLKGFDYSQQGFYFVTICVQNKLNLFGKIKDFEMELNVAGRMIEECWLQMKDKYPNIIFGEFVVMPNHFHGVIQIHNEDVGAGLVSAQTQYSQSNIILNSNDTGSTRVDTRPTPTINNCSSSAVRAGLVSAQTQYSQSNTISNSNDSGSTRVDTRPTPTINNCSSSAVRAGLVSAQTQYSQSNTISNSNDSGSTRVDIPILSGPTPTKNLNTISEIVCAFKSISTLNYIQKVKSKNWPPFPGKLWQRNYYEHIIRNENSLQEIQNYILYNPLNWDKDKLFSEIV